MNLGDRHTSKVHPEVMFEEPADKPLAGRIALVTGGDHPTGQRIAAALVSAGATVALACVDTDEMRAKALEIGATPLSLGAGDRPAYAALAYEVADQLGDVDIVVNASAACLDNDAGVVQWGANEMAMTAAHFLPLMRAEGRGVMLNIGSNGDSVWAAAFNGWVIHATRALTEDYRDDGVRFNALIPRGSASGRDLSATVVYLCSGDATQTTGGTFDIDEGGPLQ